MEEKLRQALNEVVDAWESTRSGWTSPREIQRWLVEDMAPVISNARQTLGRKTPEASR